MTASRAAARTIPVLIWEYLEALGQVLREIRVAAGLSRKGCSHVMNRDHLSKFEQGQQPISVLKLRALCEHIGVSQSLVLTAVEARMAGLELGAYRHRQEDELNRQIQNGALSAELNISAIRGVRGKRAEDNRVAIRTLQSEGLAKMEIVRKLGLSRATVDRYWLKSVSVW